MVWNRGAHTAAMVRRWALLFVLVLLTFGQVPIVVGDDRHVFPLWIDTDAACSHGDDSKDVDDCWAISYALQSGAFDIVGFSTVFGNDSEQISYETLVELRARYARWNEDEPRRFEIQRGSSHPLSEGMEHQGAAFVERLLNELSKRELTLVALGPLTNIARLLTSGRPEIGNIREIVVVAGNRDCGQPFYLNDSTWFRFSDFNFQQDPLAAEIVVNSSVPVTLVPFELSSQFVVDASLVDEIAAGDDLLAWAASRSANWLRFMRRWAGLDGFYPFDLVAFLYLEFPHEFDRRRMYARVSRERVWFRSRRELLVEPDRTYDGQARVTYVHGVGDGFSAALRRIIRYNQEI